MEFGELEESQIQNLAEILSEELTNTDVEDAVHLAVASKWDKRSRAGKEARLIELLRNANYSDDLQDVLRSLMIRADITENHALAHDLNDILAGTSVILAHTSGGYKLVSKTNEHSKEIKEEHRTFLETKAPEDVVARLDQARVLLADGDYDNALQECRRALENMTEDGNYGWALEELYDNDLIEKDTMMVGVNRWIEKSQKTRMSTFQISGRTLERIRLVRTSAKGNWDMYSPLK